MLILSEIGGRCRVLCTCRVLRSCMVFSKSSVSVKLVLSVSLSAVRRMAGGNTVMFASFGVHSVSASALWLSAILAGDIMCFSVMVI